jgi:hypothetical protein
MARVNDPQMQQVCLQRYNLAMYEAMARDSHMQNPMEEMTDWERSRQGR